MQAAIKGGILAGIVLFIWGTISWMVLPWHTATLHGFKNEKVVADIVTANISQSGAYLLPAHMQAPAGQSQQIQALTSQNQTPQTPSSQNQQQSQVNQNQAAQVQADQSQLAQPFIFASVRLEGAPSMTSAVILGLLSQIIAAVLVGWLLTKTMGLSYFGRVGFVVVFAIAASIVTHGSYWNWFGFDTAYTFVAYADLIIGWFLIWTHI